MKYLVAALLLSTISCDATRHGPARQAKPVSAIDDNGRTIELPHAATRVISLVPGATEIIQALAGNDVLVAVTKDDGVSTEVAEVGTVLEPSVERIVALQPDFVIAWADADLVLGRLAKAGIPAYAARFERIDATASHIRRIGVLLGQPRRADSLAAALTKTLQTSRRHYANQRAPSVLYLLETEPVWTTGPGTFIDDMIQIAGGRNIFGDVRTQWSQISLEAIVERQPEVIVVARHDSRAWQTKAKEPGWRDLRAVQTGRVYFVDGNRFHRPGPGVADNVRRLAVLLHNGGN